MKEVYRIPVFIGNTTPFRIIARDEEDKWEPTIDQINKQTYNHAKLCRVSKYIDVGILPFSMGVGFDGSLIVPLIPELRDKDRVLDLFNQFLGELLLGGVYSEAVLPENISLGLLTEQGYFRITKADGPVSCFHQAISARAVGKIDVKRIHKPNIVTVREITEARSVGKSILKRIPELSCSVLLNGVTYFVKHQWAEALVFIWTSIEQLLSHIWVSEVIKKKPSGEVIPNRIAFLKDNRTWSTSAKVELLYQNDLIGSEEYRLLNNARKARNDFVHEGNKPIQENAESALDALLSIMSLYTSFFKKSKDLDSVKTLLMKHFRGDGLPKKTAYSVDEVSAYMVIPPIPGDKTWVGEYEIIDELQFQDIKKSETK
jgi:hypothetical protein